MSNIIEYLEQFNRKERFFLVGMILGNETFCLSKEFRERLQETFGLEIPESTFCGMDYHLDWIYASLFLHFNGNTEDKYPNNGNITASQEDIDFIVAYQDKDIYHIILLEAKGVTGWSNKQLLSKAMRLKSIFERWQDNTTVVPHFAIVSPKPSAGLKHGAFPDWMKPNGNIQWIEMPFPDRFRISRCDKNGKPSQSGKSWKLIHEKYSIEKT